MSLVSATLPCEFALAHVRWIFEQFDGREDLLLAHELLDGVDTGFDATQCHRQFLCGRLLGLGRRPLSRRHIGAAMALDMTDRAGTDISFCAQRFLRVTAVVSFGAKPVLVLQRNSLVVG